VCVWGGGPVLGYFAGKNENAFYCTLKIVKTKHKIFFFSCNFTITVT